MSHTYGLLSSGLEGGPGLVGLVLGLEIQGGGNR